MIQFYSIFEKTFKQLYGKTYELISRSCTTMYCQSKHIFLFFFTDDLDRCDEIIKDLRSLKLYAGKNSQFQMNFGNSVACPICPIYDKFTSARQVRAHLDSLEHKESLDNLKEQLNRK